MTGCATICGFEPPSGGELAKPSGVLRDCRFGRWTGHGETLLKRVGIEVGGTFTDLVAIGPDGISVTKVPSVPHAPDEGAFNALLASGIDIA